MARYVVIEMQNGIVGGNAWCYDNRADAEVKEYQVLSEVVKSPVATHTVMLVTDEGFVLDCRSYQHEAVQAEETTEETAYSDMTKAELLALCEERGVTAYDSWTKAQIIEALEAVGE